MSNGNIFFCYILHFSAIYPRIAHVFANADYQWKLSRSFLLKYWNKVTAKQKYQVLLFLHVITSDYFRSKLKRLSRYSDKDSMDFSNNIYKKKKINCILLIYVILCTVAHFLVFFYYIFGKTTNCKIGFRFLRGNNAVK